MLLDPNLDYIISPKEIEVDDLKKRVYEIVDAMIKATPKSAKLTVYYKSVLLSFGRHRKDSAKFHYQLKKILARNNLLVPNSRTGFLLKKENLKLFKNALYFLDIDCKSRGQAFVAHLWAIALKSTRSRVKEVIQQIWKARMGIKRMNKHHLENFNEFIDIL